VIAEQQGEAFRHYCDLLHSIGLSNTEDMIRPSRTWLIFRTGMPELGYCLICFQCWHIE